MNAKKTMPTHNLIIAAIILLTALVFIIRLNSARFPPNSTMKTPVGKGAAPAGKIERPYKIPAVNAFPSDEEVKKKIKEQSERQEKLKEKIADRDKKVEIVRAEIIAIQNESLSNEIKNAQQIAKAPPKTIAVAPYVKKEIPKEKKPAILPNGCHVGH